MATTSFTPGSLVGQPKLPPQNLDAESSVLGSLLLDQNAIVKVADLLMPEDFYERRHQTIYEALLTLFEKRQPLDALTLKARLEDIHKLEEIGGASYIASLVNTVATATHVVDHANLVREKAVFRRLISAANEIGRLGYQEDQDVDLVLDQAEQTLFSVSQKFLKQNFVGIRSVLTQTFERINELTEHKGSLRGISTGFRGLDNMLAGFQKSDLIILAARPSVGKTSLALNFVERIAVTGKKKVGIFSLEMSADQLTDRLLCVLGNIDAWRLRTGNLTDADFSRLHSAMGQLAEADIFIDDSPFINVMEMRARARRLQLEKGLDFLVVDYLQLMEGTGGKGSNTDNRVQEVSYISRSLKALARELNIPLLALSQLSRAVEQRSPKIPQLSDLRESGCLTGDTLIIRADTGARTPIKELVGQTDIPVWSLDDAYRLMPKMISRVFSSGRKKVYELKLRSGRTIKASANHPFMTYQGWSRLDQLTVKQRIASPRLYPIEEKADSSEYSDAQLIFLAHMIGDGCYVPRQPVHYTSADLANIAAVRETAETAWGITGRIVPQENWYHLYLPNPRHSSRACRHPFLVWLKDKGLDLAHSYEKRLPESLFTGSKRQLALFGHHLWATDGCLSVKGNNVALYYATTSQGLAGDLQHLLLRLGILAQIHLVKQVKNGRLYRPSYHVAIQGRENQELFLRQIGVFGQRGQNVERALELLKEKKANPNLDALDASIWEQVIVPAKMESGLSWRAVSAKIGTSYCGSTLMKSGVSRERMGRLAVALASPPLSKLAESDLFWDEIVSITPLGVEEVFDATVPETHNFVANDIVVHNSIEQDADVVAFIYREDFYDPTSERKNIADILISKHRNGPTGKVELYFKVEQTKFLDIDTSHHEGTVNVYESEETNVPATGETVVLEPAPGDSSAPA